MNKHPLLHSLTFQQWLCPFIIALVSVTSYLFQSASLPLLEFSRDYINAGQWWRLLTGNLMHSNLWHLLLNIASLTLITALFGRLLTQRHFLLFSLSNIATLGVLIYYCSPDIVNYVGLSGYLYGLFIYGCLLEINTGRQSTWLLLVAVWAKIGYEQFYGASRDISELIEASVATEVHLYGATLALLQFIVYWLYQRRAINGLK